MAESYRAFMAQSRVERFVTSKVRITERGETAIIEYRWEMDWESETGQHTAKGREVLVLNLRSHGWRLVWRTQIAG